MFSSFKKVCAVVVVSLFLFPGGAWAAANWIVTKEGPKVWAQDLRPTTTASWSGAVDVKGYATGEGVLKWFEAGELVEVYEGMLSGRGIRRGKGILTLASGARYEGYFCNDEILEGVLTLPSGEHYEGGFSGGQYSRKGVLTLPSGERYEGEFSGGQYSGKGVLGLPNGERYEGGFFYGKFNGKGVLIWPDGARVEGVFKDGQLVRRGD